MELQGKINLQKFIYANLSLKLVVVKKYYTLKLIQSFLFYDHV